MTQSKVKNPKVTDGSIWKYKKVYLADNFLMGRKIIEVSINDDAETATLRLYIPPRTNALGVIRPGRWSVIARDYSLKNFYRITSWTPLQV